MQAQRRDHHSQTQSPLPFSPLWFLQCLDFQLFCLGRVFAKLAAWKILKSKASLCWSGKPTFLPSEIQKEEKANQARDGKVYLMPYNGY